MLSKNTKIILSVLIVLFIAYMIIDFNMSPDPVISVTFDPQEYSFSSSDFGIGLIVNSSNAEGIIFTSNYGHFTYQDENGISLNEGYSIKRNLDEIVYWVPEKIEVGQTVNNAIVVTAVRGLSDTLGSLSISVTQNEDLTYIARVVELPN